MVKFLIIRFSSIGDIVLTTPVIRGLKKQVEGAEVHYLTKKQYYPILKKNPYIDKIHLLDNSLNNIIQELKNEKFDFIIDLHHNLRSAVVKNKLRVTDFSFHKINFKKWLIVNFKLNKLPQVHIVDRYMKTLSIFDVKNDEEGLDYFIPEDENIPVEKLPIDLHKGYIAFVIGAKHATKRLPLEKIVSICNKLIFPVVLLGDNNDRQIGEIIVKQSTGRVLNFCGMYSINESASLVKNSKLVITHDTGLMHVAAACNKKIISIWGNTIPEFGMYPYLKQGKAEIFEIKNLKCRPCSKIGYEKCPKKHFRCMNDLDISEIVKSANSQ
ncbi:MAG: glycosyltransferase family 9 protein [Bacteroidales bacterium]|nr:glycosyltransferase family 9 protein [Bacteroidales bacterium]